MVHLSGEKSGVSKITGEDQCSPPSVDLQTTVYVAEKEFPAMPMQ